MQTLYIDNEESQQNQLLKSLSSRVGYIFSEHAIVGGISMDLFWIITSNNTSLRGKMEFIKLQDRPDETDMMVKWEELLKMINKRKHKTSQDLYILRKIEGSVNDIYDYSWKDEHERISKLGFMQLTHEIVAQGGISFIKILEEIPKHKEEGMHIMSELLQLNFEKPAQRNVAFLLSDEFLQFELVKEEMKIMENDRMHKSDIILHHCFTIPNLILLTMPEMQLLRRKIVAVGSSFNAEANKWISMFYDPQISPQERLLFLNDEVISKASFIQKSLEVSPILEPFYGKKYKSARLHIHVGEASFSLLLNYYKHFGVLTDKIWKKLQDALQSDNRLQGRFPIMVVQNTNLTNTDDLIITNEKDILTTKKYLAID